MSTPGPPGTLLLQHHNEASKARYPIPSSDPNDPLNWSPRYKAWNFALVSFYTLMTFVVLDIGPAIWEDWHRQLGLSFENLNISWGVGCAGLAIGCILFIPIAIMHGRRIVYLASILTNLGTAAWMGRMRTTGDLMGTNVLVGFAGAVSEAICQMTIADMFFVQQRGTANSLYLLMICIGSYLAPVAQGYSAAAQGWHWMYWYTVILFGICFFLFLFGYEDTKFVPVYSGVTIDEAEDKLEPSSQSLHKEKHDENTVVTDSSMTETATQATQITTTTTTLIDPSIPRKTYRQKMALLTTTSTKLTDYFAHLIRPFIILATFPAITYTALTYGSMLAWFGMTVNIYSVYYTLPPYNFSSVGIGLLNLPPLVGTIIGSIYSAIVIDRSIIWLSKRNGGVFEPEMRLWAAVPAVVLLPLSILMFGLATARGASWVIAVVALGVFGFAWTSLGDVALTYAMDCYKDVVGDAFVGIVFVRNVCATIIATCLTPWIDGMGMTRMVILSAVLAAVLSLLIVPMMIFGKRARAWTAGRLAVLAVKE